MIHLDVYKRLDEFNDYQVVLWFDGLFVENWFDHEPTLGEIVEFVNAANKATNEKMKARQRQELETSS